MEHEANQSDSGTMDTDDTGSFALYAGLSEETQYDEEIFFGKSEHQQGNTASDPQQHHDPPDPTEPGGESGSPAGTVAQSNGADVTNDGALPMAIDGTHPRPPRSPNAQASDIARFFRKLPAPAATPVVATAHAQNLERAPPLTHQVPIQDYMAHYQGTILTTRHVRVSHIPGDISASVFANIMDHVQALLRIPVDRHTTAYRNPDFVSRFDPGSPDPWTNACSLYPEEPSHAAYILELGETLEFGYWGALTRTLRPTAFEISIPDLKGRRMLAQAVPNDHAATMRWPPVAAWRGLGSSLQHGQPLAALALINQYVADVAATLLHQDANKNYEWFTYLSFHQVDITVPYSLRRNDKGRGNQKGRSRGSGGRGRMDKDGQPPDKPGPSGPVNARYVELFALTVCSAPGWAQTECYQLLIPQAQPFDAVSHPICLRGWHGELTRSHEQFRTASVA
ncbi:MAG: hypothetical protein CGW95_04115, partial [Phenylobacterium zucineum]